MSLGLTHVDTTSIVAYSEGQFEYDGTPVHRMIVTFDHSDISDVFGFDNLTCVTPDAAPALGRMGLLASVLLLLGLGIARMRASQVR